MEILLKYELFNDSGIVEDLPETILRVHVGPCIDVSIRVITVLEVLEQNMPKTERIAAYTPAKSRMVKNTKLFCTARID